MRVGINVELDCRCSNSDGSGSDPGGGGGAIEPPDICEENSHVCTFLMLCESASRGDGVRSQTLLASSSEGDLSQDPLL